MKKLNILDWYVHQGHQYEFFKTGHNFYLIGVNNNRPKWNKEHRPLNENVTLLDNKIAMKRKYDVVIIRSPIQHAIYMPYIKDGAVPIAVVQTTTPFKIPDECRHVVWNSLDVMIKNRKEFSKSKHRYIVHGYDPDEFKPINIKTNGKVLTVANSFKRRAEIMGYDTWIQVKKSIKNLDLIGHGNQDIYSRDRQAKNLDDLIKTYNSYDVYFNPTRSSAMPRSRAEAAMCGMPIVSTNNYDIGRYFVNGKTAILSNNEEELVSGIKKLLKNPSMREDYSMLAREVAINNFHIKDFVDKWNSVFREI